MEDYMKFTEELRARVVAEMGEGYETGIQQVAKANVGVTDALNVFRKDGKGKAGPAFYLPPLFGEYRKGRGVEDIAGDIAAAYHAQAADMEGLAGSLGDITSYGSIKDRIYFRLLCTERNRAFLKNVLHFEVLDLSMVVYILIRADESGIGSVPVQNRLLESWGVPAEEVRGQAGKNTPLLFPPRVLHLASAMADILRDAGTGGAAGMEAAAENMPEGAGPYIMTNTKGINGFSTVLYPGALEGFTGFGRKNLYVLPSSVHEALLLPADASMAPQELQEMVREVNGTVVEETDILSDTVYYYDRQKNGLSIAGEEEKCVRL